MKKEELRTELEKRGVVENLNKKKDILVKSLECELLKETLASYTGKRKRFI